MGNDDTWRHLDISPRKITTGQILAVAIIGKILFLKNSYENRRIPTEFIGIGAFSCRPTISFEPSFYINLFF